MSPCIILNRACSFSEDSIPCSMKKCCAENFPTGIRGAMHSYQAMGWLHSRITENHEINSHNYIHTIYKVVVCCIVGVFSRTSILGTRKRGHVRPEIVVLDIEGTISPVSFRTETVLPLVEQSLKSYLADTFDTKNTQSIIQGIREFELTNGAQGMVPAEHAGKMKVIDGCCNLMDHAKEKKIPPLMHLQVTSLYLMFFCTIKLNYLSFWEIIHWNQGAILEGALTSGDLVASIFKDVPAALKKWRAMGAKLFIYSSLPSGAQRKYLESTKVFWPHAKGVIFI